MSLKELRAALAAVHESIKAAAEKLEALGADTSDEAAAEEATIAAEIAELEGKAKRLQAQITAKAAVENVDAIASGSAGRQTKPAAPRNASDQVVEVGATRQDADPWRGFRNIQDFAASVANACKKGGRFDERLLASVEDDDVRGGIYAAPTGFHRESVGAEGGYLAPQALQMGLWDAIFTGEDLIDMVDLRPVAGNQAYLVRDETTPWGSTGIKAYWTAEGDQHTSSKISLEDSTMKLHKMSVLALMTEEEMEDIPTIEQKLTRDAGRAISWKSSDAILYGTGVGQPLGFFNGGSKVTVAKESGQSADTVVAANVLKMRTRRLLRPGARWCWLANSDTYAQFATMQIGDRPVYTEKMQDASVSERLLTFPYKESEHAKTLGDEGDVQLVDLSGWAGAVKQGGVKGSISAHLYFDYDVSTFKWTYRLAGMPYLSAAVSPANGSNTKSQYVTLAARA